MPNKSTPISITTRDLELLQVLTRGAHWTDQLLVISQRFECPFSSVRYLQKRLAALNRAGFIRSFTSVTLSDHPPRFHKLTRDGWRLLRGDMPPPTKRFFHEPKPLTQLHQRFLTDFIIHTDLAAHRQGAKLCNFDPDNSVRIRFPAGTLVPDASFDIVTARGKRLHYYVELDNSTERLRSSSDLESWMRKIAHYDALRDRADEPFRVLVVTTQSSSRLSNILSLAQRTVRNKSRPLFVGVYLRDYQQHTAPLTTPIFRVQHRQDLVTALIERESDAKNTSSSVTRLTRAC